MAACAARQAVQATSARPTPEMSADAQAFQPARRSSAAPRCALHASGRSSKVTRAADDGPATLSDALIRTTTEVAAHAGGYGGRLSIIVLLGAVVLGERS